MAYVQIGAPLAFAVLRGRAELYVARGHGRESRYSHLSESHGHECEHEGQFDHCFIHLQFSYKDRPLHWESVKVEQINPEVTSTRIEACYKDRVFVEIRAERQKMESGLRKRIDRKLSGGLVEGIESTARGACLGGPAAQRRPELTVAGYQ